MSSKTITRPTPRKIQRGITLGETLLSLSIGTALVVGAYVYYSKGSADVRAQQTAEGVNQIITGIKDRYGPLGSYAGVTAQSIITNTIVPKTFPVSGTTISTPYGPSSNITVAPADGGSTFIVTITGMPQSACPVVVARVDAASTAVAAQATATPAPDFLAATTSTVKALGATLDAGKTLTQCALGSPGAVVAVLAKSQ